MEGWREATWIDLSSGVEKQVCKHLVSEGKTQRRGMMCVYLVGERDNTVFPGKKIDYNYIGAI